MNRSLFFAGGVLLLCLSSCASPAETQVVEQAVEPMVEVTATAVPTNTLLPTSTVTPEPTSIPEPTALPEGILFRDDFTGYLQPGWRWDSEDPTRWSFVNIQGKPWLELIGTSVRSNVLMRDLPAGDFSISVHVKADPRMNFHQANIFVFQDLDNYVAVNTGYCQPCPVGGYGYFMETNSTGATAPVNHYELPRADTDMDVYLKIEVVDNVISGYYATTPGEWVRIGRFGNFFTLTSIGLSATNSSPPSGTPEDIIAQFDYFEVSMP